MNISPYMRYNLIVDHKDQPPVYSKIPDDIISLGYALPYDTEGRKVVKVGVQFDRDTMTIGEYIVE